MITNKNKCIQKKFSIGGLIGVHVSSIVNEIISSISNQFNFFVRKDFARNKTQIKPKPTNFLSLRSFYARKIVAFVVLCLLNFICLVVFGLICVFVPPKPFCEKNTGLKLS